MWGHKKDQDKTAETPQPLKDAVREARIEAAERSGVVVDLRDADVARLDLLNDALDPLFDEVPNDVDLFDRGVSKGDTPRLWIDVVAHVEMGRDKRQYRFVQDTRYGRAVLAESYEVPAMADAIKRYVARRLVEREAHLLTMLAAASRRRSCITDAVSGAGAPQACSSWGLLPELPGSSRSPC